MLDVNQYKITDNASQLPSQKYDALRASGISLIQSLGSKLWTDYNEHDPGVTILELLCYAITDLGYRTSFEIQDILTPPGKTGPELGEAFYSAAQILTHHPLTINDYRKLLIDQLPGVKNVWLSPVINEVYNPEMFVAPGGQTLTFITPNDQTSNPPLKLQGFYRVRIELEEVEFLNIFQQFDFVTQYPQLQEAISNAYLLSGDQRLITESIKTAYVQEAYKLLMANRDLSEDITDVEIIQYEYVGICADIDLARGTDPDGVLEQIYKLIYTYISPELNLYNIRQLLDKGKSMEDIFQGSIAERGFIDYDELARFDNRKVIYTSDIIALVMSIPGVQSVRKIHLSSYLLKQEQTPGIIISPTDSPFTQLEDAVTYCLHLQDANKAFRLRLDYAETDVRYMLNKFNFRIDDLGVPASIDTADGPAYIGTSNTTNTIGIGQKTFVTQAGMGYMANDLVQISGMPPSNYMEGSVVSYAGTSITINVTRTSGTGTFSLWNITPGHIPLIDVVPVLLRADDFSNDLTPPTGFNRQLDNYYSVQNEFPKAYMLGQEGIDDSETTERKAQRLQLKSYLVFFEQLLADFLAQLNSTKDILSWRTQANLYSYQYLKLSPDEIVDLDKLILNRDVFFDSGGYHSNVLESDVTRTDRRNRFLNHLLARFNESFVDLSIVKFIRRYDEPYTEDDIINDKLSFLRVYPELSGNRFHAFDYTTEVWGLPNTSGFEKRVEKKIGLSDPNSDSVSVNALIEPLLQMVGNSVQYVLDNNGNIQFIDNRADSFSSSFGMHIIEHILLRPRQYQADETNLFLKVCLNGDTYPTDCFCRDPYSFRLTAVMPGWLDISMDMDFRKFMETLIQEEVPAHITLKICWIGPDQMHEFEQAYYSFTNCLRSLVSTFPTIDPDAMDNYTASLTSFIQVINSLENIYPPSYLVGCDDITYNSDGEITQYPVILNRTALKDASVNNYCWVPQQNSGMNVLVYPPEASQVTVRNLIITQHPNIITQPVLKTDQAVGVTRQLSILSTTSGYAGKYVNVPLNDENHSIPVYYIYDTDNKFYLELEVQDTESNEIFRERIDGVSGNGYMVYRFAIHYQTKVATDNINVVLKLYDDKNGMFSSGEIFTDKVGAYSFDFLNLSVEQALETNGFFFKINGQRSVYGDYNSDFNNDYSLTRSSLISDYNDDFNNDFGTGSQYALKIENLLPDADTMVHMFFEQNSTCNGFAAGVKEPVIFTWARGLIPLISNPVKRPAPPPPPPPLPPDTIIEKTVVKRSKITQKVQEEGNKSMSGKKKAVIKKVPKGRTGKSK